MCKEDVRLARKTVTASHAEAVALGAVSQVAKADTNRISITFDVNDSTGQVVVGPNGINLLTTIGLLVSTARPPIVLTLDVHGDCVKQAWTATALVANMNLLVIEGILPLELSPVRAD